MNILRRLSTLRLIAALSVTVALATAAAVAFAGGGGPVPPKRSLPIAIHTAISGPRVHAVTARITFTNHLLPSGALGSSSPFLSGASGRLWAGDGRVRLELQADNGDTEIGFDGHTVVVYDVASGTAYEMAVPSKSAAAGTHDGQAAASRDRGVPSIAKIRNLLTRAAEHVLISGAGPTDVGGQPAYSVRVSPRHDGGLLGAVELAFDARHGIPLRVGIYAQGDSSPVLQLAATDVSYAPVDRSALAVHLAPGTKIVRVHPPSQGKDGATAHAQKAPVSGTAAVSRALPFSLAAPATLVGVPRQAVRLVGGTGSPAALVVYGHGLGAIVVLEQKVTAQKHSPLAQLPTVAVNGSSGRELTTALGTLIRFDRNGVRYTVVGSLPAASAEAAARAIG
jgi:hypothetical protein